MDPPGIPAGSRLLLPAALRKIPLFFSTLSPAWKLLASWTVPSPRPGEFLEKMRTGCVLAQPCATLPKGQRPWPAPARTRRVCSLASSSAGSSSSLPDCTGRLAGLRPFPRPGHPACGHCQHSAYGCLPWEALPLSLSSLEDTLLHPWTAPRGTRQRPVHPRAPAPSGFRSCRNATVLPSQNSESGWGLPP